MKNLCLSLLGVLLCSLSFAKSSDEEPLNRATHFYFEQNKGQWHSNVRYRAELPDGRLFLENNRLTYLLVSPEDMATIRHAHDHPQEDVSDLPIRQHAYQVQFIGATATPKLETACPSSTVRNYFVGNNPAHWASNVPLFQELNYRQLYEGVDMHFYTQNAQLKYEFIVQPQANSGQIEWQYEGLEDVSLKDGQLHLETSVQTVIEQRPYAYQHINGQLREVACQFVLNGNRVRFAFPNGYDSSQPLIIDPALIFCSFTGSTADNWGFTATYDGGGNLYAGGICFDYGYPTTVGAFQTSFAGPPGGLFGNQGMDMSISKFNSGGTDLIYSTYIGGGESSEFPHSLIVDATGNLVILGTTGSDDFPTTATAYDKTFNGGDDITIDGYIPLNDGSDIVVVSLNATGSGLVGSTYLGGNKNDGLNASDLKYNYADEARGEVFLDATGNIYIASCTRSGNFPVMAGCYQSALQGDQEACIAKFNPNLTTLLASTFLGGEEDDAAYSVKIDGIGSVYVAGGTKSNDFPMTAGAYDASYGGGKCDGFLAKLNGNLTNLLNSTYLGTNQYDQSFFVEIDEDGSILTVGQTAGDYPVSSGVYSNNNGGIYIQKFNNTFTTSQWSTLIGNGNGDPNISPTAFLVDKCNRVYVSGWGGEVNAQSGVEGSTTSGLPVTGDAFQSTTDGSDFYFIVLEEDAVALEYATFFGGSSEQAAEHVDGGTSRFDKSGIIYQAICAGCGGFNALPTTPGAWSNTNESVNCNLGVVKFDFQLLVTAGIGVAPAYQGCAPYTVEFLNGSYQAVDYFWDLGDGTTSTEAMPTHTYDSTGTYEVMLIASNPEKCNIADTAYTTITVIDPLTYNANFTLNLDCFNLNVSANPNETTGAHQWIFDDGFVSTDVVPFHHFETNGNHSLTHIINSTIPGCPATDTVTQTFNLLPPVQAIAAADTTFGCIPLTVQLSNQSINATDFLWNLGNGNTSTDPNPTVTFPLPGTYDVILTANNPVSCNFTDIDTISILVLDTIVTAQFSEILPGICDAPTVQFSSTSGDGLTYNWNFGDGTTDNGLNAAPTHTFPAPGTYMVTLIVDSPCADPDTTSHEITLLPPPLVEVTVDAEPQTGCPPLEVTLTATGNGVTYLWTLGDGTTAEGPVVTHTYTQSGSYVAQVTAIDSTTCNVTDVASVPIEVYVYAHADFEMSTSVIETGDPVLFNNLSTNATSYLWDFGDGTNTTETNPTHTFSAANTYNICLTAMNEEGCNDDTCLVLSVIPRIYIGIPNAFTPNDDLLNDVLYVEGRNGIVEMQLRIFNRWGQLVFETADPQVGWDGTFKGVQQEVDAYAYTFIANLVSGRRIAAQGNITLLR